MTRFNNPRNLIFAAVGAVTALLCCAVVAVIGILMTGTAFTTSTPCLNPAAGDTVELPGQYAYANSAPDSMSIVLPASARNIGSSCDSWLDVMMHLWFDIDPADLDTFVDQAQLDEPLTDAAYPPSFGPQPRDPESTTYQFGSRSGPCGDVQCSMTIWVDTTSSDVYRIYIFFGYGS